MTIPNIRPDATNKTAVEGLIAETRALLARLDAVAIADGAAWHVDAALNELYACIGGIIRDEGGNLDSIGSIEDQASRCMAPKKLSAWHQKSFPP